MERRSWLGHDAGWAAGREKSVTQATGGDKAGVFEEKTKASMAGLVRGVAEMRLAWGWARSPRTSGWRHSKWGTSPQRAGTEE